MRRRKKEKTTQAITKLFALRANAKIVHQKIVSKYQLTQETEN